MHAEAICVYQAENEIVFASLPQQSLRNADVVLRQAQHTQQPEAAGAALSGADLHPSHHEDIHLGSLLLQ